MQYTIEQSDGTETITIAGEMTISFADELKKVLMNALSVNDQVRLNLEQLTEVDLPSLQILCSAHRTSIKMKKSFAWTGICPGPLKLIAERSGYSRHMGCTQDCLWTGTYELGT